LRELNRVTNPPHFPGARRRRQPRGAKRVGFARHRAPISSPARPDQPFSGYARIGQLHGFFGSSGDWVHLFDLDALAKRCRLVIPAARGHRRSTSPAGRLTHRQAASDLRALVDHLGIDRFKAVGVSFGGNILLHLATAPFTVDSRTDDDWREMRERHLQGDEQIRALWRAAHDFSVQTDDQSFTPPQLAAIRAHTLIVTGDRDPLYPLEIFLEQYRAIPDAALYVIPNGGHDAIFRAARPDFVRTALAFLDGGR
jgi:pimeloyl-ACP methyl ester carboxylesterase